MINATGSGMVIRLSASETYPAGISLTAFADDKDPFKVGDLTVNEFAMGLNGDAVVFGKAGGVPISMALIQGTEDDNKLQNILNANRIAKNKNSVQDTIEITQIFPDGTKTTYKDGALLTGSPGISVTQNGRKETHNYTFMFGDKS